MKERNFKKSGDLTPSKREDSDVFEIEDIGEFKFGRETNKF